MKWNQQLLSMRCCIIEGKKFSILPNREKGRYMYIYRQSMKVCCSIVTPHGRSRRRFFFLASGHFYSAECYFFLCRYAVPVEDRIEEKGAYMYLCVCVCVHTAYCTYQLTQVYSFIYSLSLSTHFLYPPCIPFSASLITPFPFLTYALPHLFLYFFTSPIRFFPLLPLFSLSPLPPQMKRMRTVRMKNRNRKSKLLSTSGRAGWPRTWDGSTLHLGRLCHSPGFQFQY